MAKELTSEKSRRYCSNPNCGKAFDEPKVLYVCPHCSAEIMEDEESGCKFWFGYLGQRTDGEAIPELCVECEKVLDCMLKKEDYSTKAVNEIKKWWQ